MENKKYRTGGDRAAAFKGKKPLMTGGDRAAAFKGKKPFVPGRDVQETASAVKYRRSLIHI